MLFQLPASRPFGSSPLVNASAFIGTDRRRYFRIRCSIDHRLLVDYSATLVWELRIG
jgi:hypothetical protein